MQKTISLSISDWIWEKYIVSTGVKNKSALVEELIVLGSEAKANQSKIQVKEEDFLKMLTEDLKRPKT